MADQDIRRLDPCCAQHQIEFLCQPTGRTLSAAAVTPAETRTIIAADARELSDFGLYFGPAQRRRRDARFQNDGDLSLARAIHVEAATRSAQDLAGRKDAFLVAHRADLLIQNSCEQNRNNDKTERTQ